ncbi:MAG: hypothetical protein HWN81_17700 [Candidatus Lokiarchaeota archaeon]|nr:hypothetical protein [Candidatus Lokiarchaeota archaeon]
MKVGSINFLTTRNTTMIVGTIEEKLDQLSIEVKSLNINLNNEIVHKRECVFFLLN